MESLENAVKKIADFIRKKGKVVMALPGGRSIAHFLQIFKEEDLEWNNIHFFMADERLVKITDPDSNFRLLSDVFFAELIKAGKLSVHNLHPFRMERGIKEYEVDLKAYGGKFDVVILGVGEDGHVAGLFPQLSVLKEEEYFMEFHNSPKPPKDRMSSSRKLIEKADIGVLLFIGEGKKDAYKSFMDDKVSWKDCPAKILKKKAIAYTDFGTSL
jgi:6-phosphogluconolactonase